MKIRTLAVLFCLAAAGCAAHAEKRLIIAPVARNTLSYLYDHLEVEFAFCAYGKSTKELVWVQRVDMPEILKSTTEEVEFGYCRGKGFLGYGHSHPTPGLCGLSNIDVRMLFSDKEEYTFLVCPDQFVLYSKSDIRRGLRGADAHSLASKPEPDKTAFLRR